MVILDNGFFSSFDCDQRIGAIYVFTFLVQVLMVASFLYQVRRPSRYGPTVEMIDRPPLFTRRRLTAYAIWCAIFAMVSAICALLPTTTAVYLDSTSLLETGCYGAVPSEYRMDRSKIKVTFGHDPSLQSKHPAKETYLTVTQAGMPRSIFIHLQGRPASKELIELAPDAMADYSRYRAIFPDRTSMAISIRAVFPPARTSPLQQAYGSCSRTEQTVLISATPRSDEIGSLGSASYTQCLSRGA